VDKVLFFILLVLYNFLMAKTRAPLGSFSASGSIRKTLTYRSNLGQNIVSGYSKPGDYRVTPASEGQDLQREKYREAVLAWGELSSEEKSEYQEQAKPMNLTGYNLFLQLFLAGLEARYYPTLGLFGHWPFDEVSGSIAFDLSDFEKNGTLVNMSGANRIPGKRGSALNFNGSNQYVEVGTGAGEISTGAVSISFFMRSMNLGTWASFVSRRAMVSGADHINYMVYMPAVSGGRLEFVYTHGGSQYNTYGTAQTATQLGLLDGNWHNVIVSYEFGVPSSAAFYIDDFLVSGSWVFGTGSAAVVTNPAQVLSFGADFTTSYAGFYPGDMDEVFVYNRLLTGEDRAKINSI
jgi:hypothetical protein